MIQQSKTISIQNSSKTPRNQISTLLKKFQNRLNYKIDRVIDSVMSHSIIQDFRLPIIDHYEDNFNEQKIKSKSIISRNKNNKFNKTSKESSLQFKHTISYMEARQNNNLNSTIEKLSRPIGNKLYAKPKFQQRKIQIIPKKIRNDPFCQAATISADQINKGMFTLLNKGIIGKDVDIQAAFERGQPSLLSKTAILHHFQQKLVKQNQTIQPIQSQTKIESKQIQMKKERHNQDSKQHRREWSLTGIQGRENKEIFNKINNKIITEKQRVENNDINDLECYHWQFRNFKLVKTQKFLNFKKKHQDFYGNMQSIVYQIQKFLKKFSISLIYVDGQKALKFCLIIKKMKSFEIRECFVGSDTTKFHYLKNIQNKIIKQKICTFYVLNFFKMYIVRKQYLKHKKKLVSQIRIINWIKNKLLHKRIKNQMQQKSQKQMQAFETLQNRFVSSFHEIKQNKYFEIHIPNFRYDKSKEQFIQKMNTQITRIFNIKDINKYVIYVSPIPLSSEIINYYYKILELGEVFNYKERITFIEADPKMIFNNRFSNVKTLYYCSESIRRLRQKIGNSPAYIVSSYSLPQELKICLYLKIPLFSNYHIASKLNLRSQSILKFKELKLKTLPSIVINPKTQYSIYELLTKINKIYSETKCRRYIIKINNTNNGTGIATFGIPAANIQELYSKTTPINTIFYPDSKHFYKSLFMNGGVISTFSNNTESISINLYYKPNCEVQMLGTFNKISNNFVNLSYTFPQNLVLHSRLIKQISPIMNYLSQNKYFGYLDITFLYDSSKDDLYFQKLNCYLTKETSCLFYFNYLMRGTFDSSGKYLTKIIDSIYYEGETQKTIEKVESRTFLYSPYVLHFGLSQIQIKNFFQLCRIEGISFDLEKKYGSTFILIDSLKSAIGLLTTAKQIKISVRLTILTLAFLLKQNYRNSNDTTKQKQLKYRQKCNIASIKSKLEEYYDDLKILAEEEDTH